MIDYKLLNGDCVEEIQKIESDSIHFSIFSPPFAELYVYSDDPRDMGNCKDYDEFFQHFEYLIPELLRVMIEGRLVAVHSMPLPIQKGKEGYIGMRDFPGELVRSFIKAGFIFHDEICIWKDPVVEMQRTKALGLLHKQLKKDSCMSRTGIQDKVMVFRKPGQNPIPVKNTSIPVDLWQKWASPVWFDIDYGNTLNRNGAREEKDEKHIAPLQLGTIERAIALWSNEGEIVLTPFMGIGSEVYQALKMKRKGIGIELKRSYYELAVKNIEDLMQERNQLSFA